MNADLFRKAQEVFDRVSALPPDQQRAAIECECLENAALRTEVESLLSFAIVPDAFMSRSALATTSPFTAESEGESLEGRTIGAYKIERRLASGGMGAVYIALRTLGEGSDAVEQRVAFKVVKRGMDSDEIVTRFRQERRTLAKLSHPSIASLLDGGVLPDGRPFLVMEFVDGVPIDVACSQLDMSLRDRLRLFISVCHAVQFAHQNLVVHRDLKPGNILVTKDRAAKLLDFGIAKVLDTEGGTGEMTVAEMRRLTPQYASPEQVRGQPVTTISDVYSLGVILFLLLTGKRPYEFPDQSSAQIERVVCGVEPPAPSAAAAVEGHTSRALRGDLDRIVLKALRKEPEHRYSSAQNLADDIERYLTGLPVSARAPTLVYQASKFIKRHAILSTAAGVAVLSLIVITASITVQNRRIERERDDAYLARNQQEAVNKLIFEAMRTDDVYAAGHEKTVRDAIDYLEEHIDSRLSDQRGVLAMMHHTIGMIDVNLARFDEAQRHLDAAYQLRSSIFHGPHHDLGESQMGFGALYFATGRFPQAQESFRTALEIFRSINADPSEDLGSALNDLGVTVLAMGRFDEAEQHLTQALSLRLGVPAPDEFLVAETYNNLANAYRKQGRFAQAHDAMQQAADRRSRFLGPNHALTIQSLNNLAVIMTDEKNFAQAEQILLDVIPREAAAIGADHPDHAKTLVNLGRVYLNTEKFDSARKWLEAALAIREAKLDAADPRTMNARVLLARALTGLREFDLAQSQITLAAAGKGSKKELCEAAIALYEAWQKPDQAQIWREKLTNPGQ